MDIFITKSSDVNVCILDACAKTRPPLSCELILNDINSRLIAKYICELN